MSAKRFVTSVAAAAVMLAPSVPAQASVPVWSMLSYNSGSTVTGYVATNSPYLAAGPTGTWKSYIRVTEVSNNYGTSLSCHLSLSLVRRDGVVLSRVSDETWADGQPSNVWVSHDLAAHSGGYAQLRVSVWATPKLSDGGPRQNACKLQASETRS